MVEPETPKFTFPIKQLTKLEPGKALDFTWYYKIKQELSHNAASVHSNRGGGNLGHLGMILPVAEYNPMMVVGAAAAIPWIEPAYPGYQPEIPVGATGPQFKNLTDTWEHNMKAFHVAQELDKALEAQLLKAVNAKYLLAIEHHITGLANVCLSVIIK
jgi:hypothetical protein